MPQLLLIFSLLLTPKSFREDSFSKFTLWNVGQGQWVTLSTATHCHHIDSGGEFVDWASINKSCSKKINTIRFTHYDWDHIRFVNQLRDLSSIVCRESIPRYPIPSEKRKIIESIPICKSSSSVRLIYAGHPKSSNHQSHVFHILNKFLIPGDSPSSLEAQWINKPEVSTEVLVLGHHGSRTSTSSALLHRFRFKQALVSARKKRYGHPHKIVQERLKKYRIPLIKTEEWGNIHIMLKK